MDQKESAEGPLDRKVLISGAGIAGLTLGILLAEDGWDVLVVEKDPELRTDGYMMDFFGAGWDVAEKIGILDALREVRYPISSLEYVDSDGHPRFPPVPLDRIRKALDGRYTNIRRPDLARILYRRALEAGVTVRFGTSITAVADDGLGVAADFADGASGTFSLLFGADGVHSRIRKLVFGPEEQFARFLGYYVAAIRLPRGEYSPGNSLKISEEPGRVMWVYPIDEGTVSAVFAFEHDKVGRLPHDERFPFVRENYRGTAFGVEKILREYQAKDPLYFDSATQIVMPSWHRGRVALLGDACGCLTLLAGQGSHMAMAGGFVITNELKRHGGDHTRAFDAYERFMHPIIDRKQEQAVRLAQAFVPPTSRQMLFRYLLLRLIFSPLFIRWFFSRLGGKSVLAGYS
jgi:2-polyprenyl-6-methoxyphenol hydroxylase-like FAD-dependent oxidoreductase